MATIPVHAYGFAATFQVHDLVRLLPGAEDVGEPARDRAVARFAVTPGADDGADVRVAILHDFGAAVFFGFDRAACDTMAHRIAAGIAPEPHAPLTEHYLVEVRSGAPGEVRFDRIILGAATLPALEIVSLLLAQSVVMDYYEEDVREILSGTVRISSGLERSGRIPGHVRDLRRFVGRCINTRKDIVMSLALFDKPESTWDDPALDRLFGGLRRELEIDDRFRALERKLGMIQDDLMLFIELSQTRTSWRLEVIIVLLILAELLLSILYRFRDAG